MKEARKFFEQLPSSTLPSISTCFGSYQEECVKKSNRVYRGLYTSVTLERLIKNKNKDECLCT
jgi:hypothetical protein